MLGAQTKFIDQTKRVIDATEKAAFRNFGHAAASIRKVAVESIEDQPGPSPVGTPPHTHTQKKTKSGKTRKGQLPKSIAFDATKDSAIVGPRFSVVGPAGEEHEFGKDVRGEDFEARPFMGPALEASLARFADDWQGSIGEQFTNTHGAPRLYGKEPTMSVFKMGFEGFIYHGTQGSEGTNKITNSRDITETFDTQDGDTTIRGEGAVPPMQYSRVAGRSYAVEWNMTMKTNDTILTALLTAAVAGTPVALRGKAHSSGKGFDGDFILKYKHGKPLNGEQTLDWSAKPNNDNRDLQLDV